MNAISRVVSLSLSGANPMNKAPLLSTAGRITDDDNVDVDFVSLEFSLLMDAIGACCADDGVLDFDEFSDGIAGGERVRECDRESERDRLTADLVECVLTDGGDRGRDLDVDMLGTCFFVMTGPQ